VDLTEGLDNLVKIPFVQHLNMRRNLLNGAGVDDGRIALLQQCRRTKVYLELALVSNIECTSPVFEI